MDGWEGTEELPGRAGKPSGLIRMCCFYASLSNSKAAGSRGQPHVGAQKLTMFRCALGRSLVSQSRAAEEGLSEPTGSSFT